MPCTTALMPMASDPLTRTSSPGLQPGPQALDDVVAGLGFEHLIGRQPAAPGRVGRRFGPRAIDDEQVEDLGRPGTDPHVAGFFGAAELEHVAEHGDLARAWELVQQVQRRQHRLGAGVVAVVDDARAIDAVHHQQAQGGRELLQRVRGLGQGKTLFEGDRRGCQRRVDAVRSEQRQVHAATLARVHHVELDAAEAAALDMFRAHVGVLGHTVAHHARRRSLCHVSHARVVGVEYGDPI